MSVQLTPAQPTLQVIVTSNSDPDVPGQVPQNQSPANKKPTLHLDLTGVRKADGPGSPASPASPDPLLPPRSPRHLQVPSSPRSPQLTPRSSEFASYMDAFDRKIATARSPYEKWRIRCTKVIFQYLPSCITKTLTCGFPPQPACCCKTEKVDLQRLKEKMNYAKNCGACCGAISCCLECICTLGQSLRRPENSATVAPMGVVPS